MTEPRSAAAPLLALLPRARIVGGAVRDMLAGRPVADIDLATPDPPEAVVQRLKNAGLRVIPTGLSHGTVTALLDGRPFEITTLRRDIETDGRHAIVAWTDDWAQDAARRDFTLNAMSMDAHGRVFDYFGGQEDLAAGRLRFVGDPAARIAEDRLRVLRYFRFFARYAREDVPPDIATALAAAAPGLASLSAERVWSELRRILGTPDPVQPPPSAAFPVVSLPDRSIPADVRPATSLSAAIDAMQETGVLAATIPEGADAHALDALLQTGAPADPLLRLAALLTGDPAALASRLRLSAEEAVRLEQLRALAPPPPDATDAALRRALADLPADRLIDATWLAQARTGDPAWAVLRARLAGMPAPVFPLAGRDVLAMGVAPGPAVGAALASVRAWWLAGGCVADAKSCRARLAGQLAGI